MTASPSRAATSAAFPLPLTTFVGREREIVAICELLPTTRLLTITGAGGSGKTRLALEVAARTAEAHADGACWIDCSALREPALVAMHLATTLGLRVEAAASPADSIIAALREQERLLVLDNCEHLLDACSAVVTTLLQACPAIRVLATSREALGVGGERSWLVPVLSLPDARCEPSAATLLASEAVQLFVARAREVQPAFALTDANAPAVLRICRRVDGLPLAVELAAARVRMMPVEQIAARLEASFRVLATGGRAVVSRHRTLRAAIDWSVALLSQRERLLLARLSVFAGGFTLESAEHVCGLAPLADVDVLDLLGGLFEKSLVVMQEDEAAARYRLLETVREFASEQLWELYADDASVLLHRHAQYYADLVAGLEPLVMRAAPGALRAIDRETDNCRAALAWSHEQGQDGHVGLPLAASLVWYWYHRQTMREGARVLDSALHAAADATPTVRSKALHGAGIFALYAGNAGPADDYLRAAETIWRETRDDRWLAFTLSVRTTVALSSGHPERAEVLAEECVRAARRTGVAFDIALASAYPLMAVKMWRKDWLSADALLAESETVFRTEPYPPGLGFVLDARAYVALELGEDGRAARLARLALEQASASSDRWLAARSMRVLATLATRVERHELAATLFGASDARLSVLGLRTLAAERDSIEVAEGAVRTSLGAQAFAAAQAGGSSMSFASAVEYACAQAHEFMADEVRPQRVSTIATEAVAGAPVLEVRALGPLEISAAGRRVALDAWRYARPRELLLYLLAHPDGRTREQIGLVFWPDASVTGMKNNFHVTLHQIRKTLARPDVIVFADGRYRVNWDIGVVFDAGRFDHDVRASLRQRTAVSTEALGQALALYNGPFLDDAGAGDWYLEHRDHLRRLFEDGMLALGRLYTDAARHADAADVYRRLLLYEPLNEEVCRALMRTLALLGRRDEALQVESRMAARYRDELEAEVSKETVALAAAIRRGEAI